jgi:hypothetical protein
VFSAAAAASSIDLLVDRETQCGYVVHLQSSHPQFTLGRYGMASF